MGAVAYAVELEVPATAATLRYGSEDGRLSEGKIIDGHWAIEEMAGRRRAASARSSHERTRAFNVLVAPPAPHSDVDVSGQSDFLKTEGIGIPIEGSSKAPPG
jgi:hypothetical protein